MYVYHRYQIHDPPKWFTCKIYIASKPNHAFWESEKYRGRFISNHKLMKFIRKKTCRLLIYRSFVLFKWSSHAKLVSKLKIRIHHSSIPYIATTPIYISKSILLALFILKQAFTTLTAKAFWFPLVFWYEIPDYFSFLLPGKFKLTLSPLWADILLSNWPISSICLAGWKLFLTCTWKTQNWRSQLSQNY